MTEPERLIAVNIPHPRADAITFDLSCQQIPQIVRAAVAQLLTEACLSACHADPLHEILSGNIAWKANTSQG